MGKVRDLIRAEGAAAAGMFGPPEYAGLEEGAVDNQLTAAFEQIQQAYLAFGSFELVQLLDRYPRHSPAFGGQSVAGSGQGLLLHEKLLPRSLPLLLRRNRWLLHCEMRFRIARCHFVSPSF